MPLPEIIKDIEARVKDIGDIMTGSLILKLKDSNITFINSTTTKAGVVKMFDTGALQLYSNDASSSNYWLGTNSTSLLLYPASANSDITRRLLVNWDGVSYAVLHTANREFIFDHYSTIGNQTQGAHDFNNCALGIIRVIHGGYITNSPWEVGSNHYGTLLHFGSANNNYLHQLMFDNNGDTLYYRSYHHGVWRDWFTILTTKNYTSTLDSRYITTANIPHGATWTALQSKNGTTWHRVQLEGSGDLNLYKSTNSGTNWTKIHTFARVSEMAATYLPLKGGTLTGSVSLKLSNLDCSLANNNITTNSYPSVWNLTDTANRIVTRLEAVLHANSGIISGYWYVRNYDTSGTAVGQKGIKIQMTKAGVFDATIEGRVAVEQVQRTGRNSSWYNGRDNALIRQTTYTGYNPLLSCKTTNGSWELGPYTDNILYFVYNTDTGYNSGANTSGQWFNSVNLRSTGVLYGAAWNDYAEYRKAETTAPGRVVIENENGEMKISTDRLQPGAEIISDTFGFAIGETEEYKTPIAATGRVLAYPNEDRYSYPLGCAVCSGPNGTVSQMTREEIREYPERMIGTVSEIPEYKTWGTGNVEVDGRIWIRIR